jgi:adenosine deaminase
MLRRLVLAAALALAGATGAYADEARTAQYFDAIAASPPLRTAFLRAMPKGGELHVHLSGAIYAENYIRWAGEDGLCVHRAALTLVMPPCDPAQGTEPAAILETDRTLRGAVIDNLSMRNHSDARDSGHDHFFATFAKFNAATHARLGDMIAEYAARLAAENTFYVEVMTSPGMGDARALGAQTGWSEDWNDLRARLSTAEMDRIVARARERLDEAEARKNTLLRCGTPQADAGCKVTVRYLSQVIRVFPHEQVFAEILLATRLMKADPRVVGLNLVAPEDDPVTLRGYTEQMRMVGFLTDTGRASNVALHAGEVVLGLVPPEDLRFHIRQAVELAGAKRIGHGTGIAWEDDATGLMAQMAQRKVLIEINPTSSEQILSVAGKDHPFPVYRRMGVPIALSTDDPGVSRIDLSHEYQRIARDYGLGYRDLKVLARNALEYSFAPGASLWAGDRRVGPCAIDSPAGTPSAACRAFLDGSEKAREQWRLEAAFARFETTPWPAP